MEQPFWEERWRAGQIGFHLGAVNPHLVRHAARLLPAPGRVFLPLCGKSLDLGWLAGQGHDVWGIEIVEQAAATYFAEQGVTPAAIRVGPASALRHGRVTIVVGDFLTLDPATLGRFPALFDRAALIAVARERRHAYVQRLHAFADDDARVLLVTLDHDMSGGPPFSLPGDELASLAAGRFTLDKLDDVDALSAEPRFRDKGATRMREQIWLLQRCRAAAP